MLCGCGLHRLCGADREICAEGTDPSRLKLLLAGRLAGLRVVVARLGFSLLTGVSSGLYCTGRCRLRFCLVVDRVARFAEK